MPTPRLLHANYRTGRKTRQLSKTDLIAWLAYQQSADDFGVCPASPLKLQGDDPWLEQESTGTVRKAIEKLIAVGLVLVFEENGSRYLYQADWQDWQRIRYPRNTSFPRIPDPELARCSEKTRALILTFWGKRSNEKEQRDPDVPPADADASADPVNGRSGVPISGPRPYDRRHAGHLMQFCPFKCLSEEKTHEFAKDLPRGQGDPLNFERVVAWAESVMRGWGDRPKTEPTWYEFWQNRWAEHLKTLAATPARADELSTARHLAMVRELEQQAQQRKAKA